MLRLPFAFGHGFGLEFVRTIENFGEGQPPGEPDSCCAFNLSRHRQLAQKTFMLR